MGSAKEFHRVPTFFDVLCFYVFLPNNGLVAFARYCHVNDADWPSSPDWIDHFEFAQQDP